MTDNSETLDKLWLIIEEKSKGKDENSYTNTICLLYTSPSPRD